MPVIEMALFVQSAYLQLQRLFARPSRDTCRPKKRCNRRRKHLKRRPHLHPMRHRHHHLQPIRHLGGQEQSEQSELSSALAKHEPIEVHSVMFSPALRRSHLPMPSAALCPAGNRIGVRALGLVPKRSSQANSPADSLFLSLPPSLPAVPTLPSLSARLTASPIGRQLKRRMRLQQRPLLENVLQVMRLHLPALLQRVLPPEDSKAAAFVAAASSNTEQLIRHVAKVLNGFIMLSEQTNTSLALVGSRYMASPAALEVLDLKDLSEDLNNMVIDYLLSDDEFDVIVPLGSLASASHLTISLKASSIRHVPTTPSRPLRLPLPIPIGLELV